MSVITRSIYILAIVDALIVAFTTMHMFAGLAENAFQLFITTLWFFIVLMFTLYAKGFYNVREYEIKDIYFLFEAVAVTSAITAIPLIILGFNIITFLLLATNATLIFIFLLCRRNPGSTCIRSQSCWIS